MRDRHDRDQTLVLGGAATSRVLDEAMVDAHVGDARRERGAKEVQRALDVAGEMRVAERTGAFGQRDPLGAHPGDDQRGLGCLDQGALQRRRARALFRIVVLR